jgi:hypothetical protein
MKTTIVDDRSTEQKSTHVWGIVAKDKFMSNWGGAAGGNSRCAWAVPAGSSLERVFNWVAARKEMRNVNIVNLNTYRAPRGTVHFHIYVVGQDHPALG